ncbi:MAG: hypothetical protein SGJ04_08135, partial [Bacteroidota bacterium]|nr:hypothetical protein [Bacteroidota bacterium]
FLLWKFEKFLNGHFKNVEIYPYNIFSYGISYWLPQNRITELLVRALLFLETRLLLKLPLFQELCGNFIIVLKK